MDTNKEFEVAKKVILEKVRFGMYKYISAPVLKNMDVRIFQDIMSDAFICHLKLWAFGKNDACLVEYYESWWQEIRVRILPGWWLRRRPSRKKRISFSVTYPTLDLCRFGKHEPRVDFQDIPILKKEKDDE